MGKQTLHITDQSGKRVGVIFLNVDSPTESTPIFESLSQFIEPDSTPQITHEKRNFWASDGATYAVAGVFTGGVLFSFAWWYDIPLGPIVAAGALLVGVGLHVLKIVLHRPARPTAAEPGPSETVIKVEQISSDGKHWLLEELDESISMGELQSVAAAVVDKNKWARAVTTKAGLSQGKHQKLQQDFLRLSYLEPLPNNVNGYRVTGTGRRFLLQIAGNR